MGFRVGDIVTTKSSVFWQGDDIGDRLGKVISTTGHIIIELYDYYNNPIKCFSWELDVVTQEDEIIEISDEDLEAFFTSIDAKLP